MLRSTLVFRDTCGRLIFKYHRLPTRSFKCLSIVAFVPPPQRYERPSFFIHHFATWNYKDVRSQRSSGTWSKILLSSLFGLATWKYFKSSSSGLSEELERQENDISIEDTFSEKPTAEVNTSKVQIWTGFSNLVTKGIYQIWFISACSSRFFHVSIRLLPLMLVCLTQWLYPTKLVKKLIEKLLMSSLEASGPTFIKLGQWASTRPDIFDPVICQSLKSLHEQISPHSLAETKLMFEEDFHTSLEEVFEEFNGTLLGSGCVAQVYLAKIRPVFLSDPKLGPYVAVKVRHPGAYELIRRDISVIKWFSMILNRIPSLYWLALPEMFSRFSAVMMGQVDMNIEADNLDTFNYNFRNRDFGAVFPKPISPLVSARFLTETLEKGIPIQQMVHSNDHQLRSLLAESGIKALFKMILQDNFLHGDMHPGNLHVHLHTETGKSFFHKLLRNFAHFPFPYRENASLNQFDLIFLDAGITTKLSESDRRNFVELFRAVVEGRGYDAGQMILDRSPRQQCNDPEGLKTSIEQIVNRVNLEGFTMETLVFGDIIAEVLDLVRRNHVQLETNFTNLIVGVTILEGLGRQLDPNIDIFRTVSPFLRDVSYDLKWSTKITLDFLEFLQDQLETVSENPFTP